MENDFKSILSLLPLIPFICSATAINSLGPPRLIPEAYVMERVVPEGARVQLPCPVEADPDTLFFEWYRGSEPLNIFHEDRFRVQSNGVLKIKSAVPQDSGLYVCRAVNGFGKLETNVTLVVLADVENLYKEFNAASYTNHRQGDKEPPTLVNVTRTEHRRLIRPAGAALRLVCRAVGNPEPQLVWLKDGHSLNMSSSSSAKKSRWSLYIRSLQDEDQGNYTCVAYNLYGHSNYTVALDVIPGDRKKPELRVIHPVNTTVEEGGRAILQCRVKSEIKPHVQWLKQADPHEAEIEGHKVIRVNGEYFRILKSNVSENSDGSLLTRLFLNNVSKKDAGKYICLGANTIGYSFRSAFLSIHGTSETFISDFVEEDSGSIHLHFNTLFITIPVALGILVTLVGILAMHYYNKPRPSNPLQAKYEGGQAEKAVVAPMMAHFPHHLGSSEGTWSHVQSSLVIDPGQPDSFSECDSSFVFLGDLNMYPDIMYRENGHVCSLFSPNNRGGGNQEKALCLDRV